MLLVLTLFGVVVLSMAIGIGVGYYFGRKDGIEEESKKCKKEEEYSKKEGVKIE